jgi:hypothetical protein
LLVAQDPLCVPDALVIREAPLNVSASLAVLPALTFLTIAFRLEQGVRQQHPCAPSSQRVRTCVLDFSIACRPSFTMIVSAPSLPSHLPSPSPSPEVLINLVLFTTKETFTRPIRPLGQLRILALRVVPSSGEDDLCACGTRIVRASPRLTSIELVFFAADADRARCAHARQVPQHPPAFTRLQERMPQIPPTPHVQCRRPRYSPPPVFTGDRNKALVFLTKFKRFMIMN